MRRRLGLWLLRGEIDYRVAAAQRLSTDAYSGRGAAGRRGRAWWNGYQRALEALRDSTQL
jgi:hypothetical protein